MARSVGFVPLYPEHGAFDDCAGPDRLEVGSIVHSVECIGSNWE